MTMSSSRLTKEEKDILQPVEQGDWRSARGVKGQIERYRGHARATVRKDKRINIRMSEKDLVRRSEERDARGGAVLAPHLQRVTQVHQRRPDRQDRIATAWAKAHPTV